MVAAKIDQLAGDLSYRQEIIARCGCGAEFLTELDSLANLSEAFCRDIGTG